MSNTFYHANMIAKRYLKRQDIDKLKVKQRSVYGRFGIGALTVELREVCRVIDPLRWGITNAGGGCGVHCGICEIEVCRLTGLTCGTDTGGVLTDPDLTG